MIKRSLALTAILLSLFPMSAFAKGSHSGAHSTSKHAKATSATSNGDHTIRAHTKSNGTYVTQSHAKNPNKTKSDNYSTKGNINPYTGKAGTKKP